MLPSTVTVYVGLGSNLDNPEHHVRMALDALARIPNTRLVRHSSFYRSAPMGPSDQPDYINAVAALETTLSALDMMAELQSIERQHGRVRGANKWGPRTLDLDLLLYGDERIAKATLTVPHPGITERPFVLYPLSEIAPTIDVPGYGPLEGLLRACPAAGLERLDTSP
jgi:2-amino-4-hydroxy-6-hydroxymethyldihydropteridine diphosphokinase